jgi:3-isopropylmalate dehydratase small subunit
MEKFSRLTGVAAPLPITNIDTDMIIPKDYLKTIKRTGLGKGLFAEMRYNEDGTENPDFVLNSPPGAMPILIAGDNFGCGSSREHAPMGTSRLRHPLRDFHQLRRHLLQQLLQERHSADRRQPGRPRQADG